ncbi:MAG TPA: cupin domain-containing protein [Gaiellaceae bacterium]|jgi:quercetin dioxygenase-like cupin family protein|nr:cupin domain-containing protein [Gaiellaceae bacterium]
MDAIVLRRDEGEEVATRERRSVLVKIDLEQIGMTESWFGSRQQGAAPHIHRAHADSFYVLDGELTFLTADGSLHAPKGGLCIAPPGVVHGFDHDADEEVRYLNFHIPGRGFIESLRARRRDPSTYDQTRYDSFEPPDDAPLGAAVIAPGEGDRLESDTRVATTKVGRDELALVEFDLQPGFEGPSTHIHRRHVDSFYVVAGEPQFRVGDEIVHGEPGMLVAAPPGIVHSFSNPGPAPARVVNVHAPSCGFHEYLHVMDETDGELDEATHANYDTYAVD